MPLIKVVVDDSTYALLSKKRRAAGLPSIAAYLLKQGGVLTGDGAASEIVKRALKVAKAKTAGETFRMRDLFRASEWERFDRGARVRAGKLFYERIGASVDGIRPHAKSKSNQQIYVRAKEATS